MSAKVLFLNETNLSPGPIDSKINVPLRKSQTRLKPHKAPQSN